MTVNPQLDIEIVNTCKSEYIERFSGIEVHEDNNELKEIFERAQRMRVALEKEGLFNGQADEALVCLLADILASFTVNEAHMKIGIKAMSFLIDSLTDRAYHIRKLLESAKGMQ